jgi:hypothetical protein
MTPKWFRVLAAVALVWNLLGCAAYLADRMVTPADVAKMSPAQQELYAARSPWGVGATAVAVWGGAAGCLGLLLLKRWSYPVLVASLAGLIVQDVGLFAIAGAASKAGAAAVVLQTIVLAIAIGLVLLARRAIRLEWVS